MVIGGGKYLEWKDKDLFYKLSFEKASRKRGEGNSEVYQVLGFANQKEYNSVPKKLQKNCRRFLKGTQKETGINGLSKIIFAK